MYKVISNETLEFKTKADAVKAYKKFRREGNDARLYKDNVLCSISLIDKTKEILYFWEDETIESIGVEIPEVLYDYDNIEDVIEKLPFETSYHKYTCGKVAEYCDKYEGQMYLVFTNESYDSNTVEEGIIKLSEKFNKN